MVSSEVLNLLHSCSRVYLQYKGFVWVYRVLWMVAATVTLVVVVSGVGFRWLLVVAGLSLVSALLMVVASYFLDKYKHSLFKLPFQSSDRVWFSPGFHVDDQDNRRFGFVFWNASNSVWFVASTLPSLPSSVLSSWILDSAGVSYNVLTPPVLDFVRTTDRGYIDLVPARTT